MAAFTCRISSSIFLSGRFAWNPALAGWMHVVESDEIDLLPPTVLRDLEEVDHTLETRRSSELGSDIRETDRQDRIHLDLTLFHPVAVADLDVGTQPYPDAASDVAATNSVTQALGEYHLESLLPAHERRNVSIAPVGHRNRASDGNCACARAVHSRAASLSPSAAKVWTTLRKASGPGRGSDVTTPARAVRAAPSRPCDR